MKYGKLLLTPLLLVQDWSKICFIFTGLLGLLGTAAAQQYQVTVTSLVHGTPATLIPSYPTSTFVGTACPGPVGSTAGNQVGEMLGLWVFATHNQSFSLFSEGQPAIPNLARLSQTGRPFWLASQLSTTPGVGTVFTIPPDPGFVVPNPTPFPPATGLHDIVLCPGESLTTTVTAQPTDTSFTMAAMIFPTNDGFVALNGVPLPSGNNPVTYYSPAYDSGSEQNDELCGDIPSLIIASFPFSGTTIGGAGKSPGAACPDGTGLDNDINSDPIDATSTDNLPSHGEGYVHIHPGIRGIGDLDPRVWGWENAVMQVTITAIPGGGTPLTITTTSLNGGVVNAAYSQLLTATGGTPPYTWASTSGRLPVGLTLNALTGLISGTPIAATPGSSLRFQVTDASSPPQTATASFTVIISP